MYGERDPQKQIEQSLQQFGLPADVAKYFTEPEKPPFKLWPQHRVVFNVFNDLRNEWRTGQGVVFGLRSEAVLAVMELHNVKRKYRKKLFEQIKVVERASLNIINQSLTD